MMSASGDAAPIPAQVVEYEVVSAYRAGGKEARHGWCSHPDCGVSSPYAADMQAHTYLTGHLTLWLTGVPLEFRRERTKRGGSDSSEGEAAKQS